MDHDGHLPSFAVVTEGKHSGVTVARSLRLEAGTILVIDRGYNDFGWFAEMTQKGVFFVTRMKTNTVYRVEEECEIPVKGNVLRDQIISLPALRKAGQEPVLFRRIEYWNQEKREILVFFTNLLHLAASTIAAIYKDRWAIELFFKVLKSPLKVKTFLGTSANAVKTQIWTALIAMLILKYLQMKSTFGCCSKSSGETRIRTVAPDMTASLVLVTWPTRDPYKTWAAARFTLPNASIAARIGTASGQRRNLPCRCLNMKRSRNRSSFSKH